MKVLVTGGAGYIGSTVCSALKDHGHIPVILDSLITGKETFTKEHIFYKGDIADKELLNQIFTEHPEISHTIHFAALIVVPESVERPYDYYKENVCKSLELFNNLRQCGCKNIVFSSSASIYGDSENFIVNEHSSLNPRSPYARTKYMMEMILDDFCHSYDLRGISLRYFNPIGADPNLRTGAHIENPSHLLGKLVTAASTSTSFQLTGVNWPTRDGSGIRDYIHVWDLAMAHVKAVENFESIFESKTSNDNSYTVINLGSGNGVTVKEFIHAFEVVSGSQVTVVNTPPRPGDVAGAFANTEKAMELLDWSPKQAIADGIKDALRWEEKKINHSIIKENIYA